MSEPIAATRGLPSTIREGEILGGKYRLEREIGRGSMGTVWSAVHLTLGQRVAIKLIATENAQAEEARQRFSTEAKAAARLRSRYVVQVYDDGETSEGTPYIVLEYLEGETLEQRLERERDLPLNDAVRVTRHVARALSRAHASGIVHRDLKPGNVFLTRSEDDEQGWVAKVLDFGIAKVVEHGIASTTKTGALLGTPLFMSPEQVRGANSVDARSDLYALGMVFYNMLTGRYAFNGDSFADVLVAICTGPLPDLRETVPWVPQSVAEWFQRACARDASLRFQSADELIEALDLALGVSTGAYARQSSPEVRIDTLRGHAPPVPHSIPRPPPDSGEFAKAATQLLTTHEALLETDRPPARSAPARRVASGHSRTRWLAGGALALLAMALGVTPLLRTRDRAQPIQSVAAAPSAKVVAAIATSVTTSPSQAQPSLSSRPPSGVPSGHAGEAQRSANALGGAPTAPKLTVIRNAAPKSITPPSATPPVAKAISMPAPSSQNANTDIGF